MAAMVLEPFNFVLAWGVPLDVGFPPGTSFFTRLLFEQAFYLHYPVFLLMEWIDRFANGKMWEVLFALTLFAIGYINTVVLILAFVLAFRFLRCVMQPSFRPAPAMQH
jgi:hypothetical protein